MGTRKIRAVFSGSTREFPGGSGWKAPVFTGSVFSRLNRKICGRFRVVNPVPVEPENRVPVPGQVVKLSYLVLEENLPHLPCPSMEAVFQPHWKLE